MKTIVHNWLILIAMGISTILSAQSSSSELADSMFANLKFRSIGPALMSGRIADIAIHPYNNNIWYVAVGSGGVWKTNNSGTTWTPLFDKQSSYSIGCITIDENNPHTVWVGTGENVGGRHVAFGDGIYKSTDDGKNWVNMGLKNSEHISKIIVHPTNSDIVWVASQGPLWSSGGERGLYKTTDGGKTWNKTLGDDEWVGATDILIDPRNPDRLYAATWERHRNIAAYIGGGPGTAIYRSEDGGENWQKLSNGIPHNDKGKIGLAISPQQPDIIYAAIELDRRTGGIFRSEDRGESWTKMSNTVSGATGPHYYQELYASPHTFDKLYLVDVRMQISEDGGKTFRRMKEEAKHSDNHAIAFRKDDPNYLLVGTDGGIYESFDLAKNWRYISNLPITQYYKVAVDDAVPFYHVFGGTQDNYTQGGPSRTSSIHGIRNSDWFITLFADGHQPATEPGNPDIMYSEFQEGNLFRIDRKTSEIVYIQPQPNAEDPVERYNWDAPILVSPHNPSRIYHASQRVWRSEDRGDSWTPISGDLTKNQERVTLPVHGKTRSWNSGWDLFAMSNFNTITSLSESPVKEGLLYAGTDDGLIQVTEDGGLNWRKINVSDLPNVPETAFINDIKADLYDENTVYIALDNHKYGDYSPYLLKSTDKGRNWKSIKSNLPERTLVWRIVQDHVNPELLFTATEFGVYFTVSSGDKWIKLSGGMPTISVRDLAIQRRENDLVAASFGRGFFILDDYTALRNISNGELNKEATLFPTKKAWWYIQKPSYSFNKKGSQGASTFTAPNPPFGAVFTYYLSEKYETQQSIRQENEKALRKKDADIPFPSWEALDTEKSEQGTKMLLTIKNSEGDVIRRIETPAKTGFNRIAWDLHFASKRVINSDQAKKEGNREREPQGYMALPGEYSVTLSKISNGKTTLLAGPDEFIVEQLYKGALASPSSLTEKNTFYKELEAFQKEVSAASLSLNKNTKQLKACEKALLRSSTDDVLLEEKLYELKQKNTALLSQLNGSPSKNEIGEKNLPTISDRLRTVNMGTGFSSYGPTPNLLKSFHIAKTQFEAIKPEIEKLVNMETPALQEDLLKAGAPFIE